LVAISGSLKESLRFAREDGLDHPEVQRRLADSQQWAVELERFHLRPETLTTLPPTERQQAEALLPVLRRLRQQIGEARSVDALTAASALAGRLATQAQVVAAVSGQPGVRVALPPPPPDDTPTGAYSRYAPDMSVDTSCLACGRSHLAGIQGALEAAARAAQTPPWTDPAVQDRLVMAQEELAALLAYDWTPAKIAASPPDEQALVRPVAGHAQQLLDQLRQAQTADDLAAAAAQARAMRAQLAPAPALGQ